jgi:hypothetical protein
LVSAVSLYKRKEHPFPGKEERDDPRPFLARVVMGATFFVIFILEVFLKVLHQVNANCEEEGREI